MLLFGNGNVRDVRQQVTRSAVEAGLGPVRTDDLTLAVWSLAVNSVQHGGGEGVLRIWQEHDALVCEVRDSGCIDDPLAGRRIPVVATSGQRGIWLVNQLCDLVQGCAPTQAAPRCGSSAGCSEASPRPQRRAHTERSV